MSLVVVGGHSRNVGKTSVVAGLIAAMPEYRWTAMKITQYGHGVCSRNGEACGCATASHSWTMDEERDRCDRGDTSRFLAAGAERVWWVRTEQGRLAEAMPAVREKLGGEEYAIVESNSLMKFMRPDVYLAVLDPGTADFKTSAQEVLDRADAFVVHAHTGDAGWERVNIRSLPARPLFRIVPPEYVTREIIDFVRSRLS
ncbi:MAG: hypothetical protein H0X25_19895 [Acidobacteriales bacterium]|nr:hypothetical protein [Terriglobales bacterium]